MDRRWVEARGRKDRGENTIGQTEDLKGKEETINEEMASVKLCQALHSTLRPQRTKIWPFSQRSSCLVRKTEIHPEDLKIK